MSGTLTLVPVSFLLDTGADYSVLFPIDAQRLWPAYPHHDFGTDPARSLMVGVGGGATFVWRDVVMQFNDDSAGSVGRTQRIWIAPPTEADMWGLPSLLGRDVLGQFTLTVSEPRDLVTLELPR